MIKKYTLLIIVILSSLFAQEENKEIKERYVYVPYQHWQEVWKGKNKEVKLSLQEYAELVAKQPINVQHPPQDLVIKSAVYDGEIHDNTLIFSVSLEIESFVDTLAFCDFFFGRYGISDAKLNDTDAALFVKETSFNLDLPVESNKNQYQQAFNENFHSTPENLSYRLLIKGKGVHVFTMLCHKNMDIKRDVFSTNIALGNFSQQTFSLKTQDQYIYETNPSHIVDGDKIYMYPQNKNIELSLRPKEKQDEKKAIELVDIYSSHLVKLDSIKSHFVMDLNVEHQPLKTFQFVIPPKLDLLNISENRWEVSEKNGQRILTVQLEKDLLGKHTVHINAETQLLADGNFSIPKLVATGNNLFRQDGLVYIEKSNDVNLEIVKTNATRQLGLYNTSNKKNYQNNKFKKQKINEQKIHNFGQAFFASMKIWNDEHDITLNKSKIENTMESDVAAGLSIYPDGLELVAHANFTVTDGEIKQIAVKLPAKWVLTKIDTFSALNATSSFREVSLSNYYIKDEVLVLPLENKLFKGNIFKVSVVLQRLENNWLSKWKGTRYLDLPVIVPQEAKYLPSFMGIIAHQDYAIRGRDLVNLTTVDLNIIRSINISSENLVQGYKLHSTDAKGVIEVTHKEPQVSVVATHYIEIEAERIKYATTLVYNIKNSSVDTFRFAIPESFNSILNISDDRGIIKEKRQTMADNRKIWQIDVQKKVIGNYSIYLTHEVPIVQTSQTYEYTPIYFYDVEYIKGFMGIQKSSRLDVERTVKNLEEIAPREIPIFAHPDFTPSNDFSYTAKYTKENYELSLRVGVHGKADVVSAILESVVIRSLFPGNGSERVECVYQLKHLGKQFFSVRLPENANFWSAIVNDQGELPLRRNNDITIPIPPNNGQAINIRVVYERPAPPLEDWGQVKLERPETDAEIPVRSLKWEVYLPEEYEFAQKYRSTKQWDIPWYVHSKSAIKTIFSSMKLSNGYYKSDRSYNSSPKVPSAQTNNKNYAPQKEVAQLEKKRSKRKVAEKQKYVEEQRKAMELQQESEKLEEAIQEMPMDYEDNFADSADELDFGGGDQAYPEEPTSGEFDFKGIAENNAPETSRFEKLGRDGYLKDQDFRNSDKDADSNTWDQNESNLNSENNIGDLLSSSDLGKMGKKSSIETVKAKGLRSMNINLNLSRNSKRGNHVTPPQTRSIDITYAKNNIFRSLFFLIVALSLVLNFAIVSQKKMARAPIFLTILLAASFAPLWLGEWLTPLCNAVVLGLFISILLHCFAAICRFIGRIFTAMGHSVGIGKTTVVILAVSYLFVGSSYGYAQENTSTLEQRNIYVPYDPEKLDEWNTNKDIFISYDEYLKLWNNAHPENVVEKNDNLPAFILYNATYNGGIENNQVVFNAQIRAQVFQAPIALPLGLADTSITEAILSNDTTNETVAVDASEKGYRLVVQKPGIYSIRLKFIPNFELLEKRGKLSFQIASIPATKVEFVLDKDMEADLDSFQGGWLEKKQDDQKSLVLFPGTNSSINIIWYESSERYRAKGLNLSVESQHDLTTYDNSLRLISQLKYTVASGECQNLQLRIPQGWEVIQLSCDHLEQWVLSREENYNLIKIQLADNKERNISLRVEAEKLTNPVEGEYLFPELEPLGVNRENGHATLTYEDPYKIIILDQSSVRKISSSSKNGKFSEIFRYNQHPFDLKFVVEKQKYKNFTRSHLLIAIEKDKIEAEFTSTLEVKGQQLFRHDIKIPQDWKVLNVQERQNYKGNIADWRIKDEIAEQKTLEIIFYRSINKDQKVNIFIELEKEFSLDKEIPLPTFVAKNVEYESGTILIASSSDLELRSEKNKGIQEYDTTPFKLNRNEMQKRIAFRYEGIDYSGKIYAELRKPEVSVKVVINSLVEDDWLNFGYFLSFEINYAGVDTFHFRLPKQLGKYLDILGENIREKRSVETDDFISWTVILHNKVKGVYELSLFPDIIKNSGTGIEFYPILFPADIQKQINIVLQNQSQYEITEQKMTGITPVSAKQIGFLPPSTTANDFIRSYKVSQNEWQLVFSENKQKIQHSVHAEVDTIKIDTILQKTGESYHRVIYNLRHSGLQFLELESSPNLKIWGTFVANRFVRPSKKEENGKEIILIPLYRTTHKEQKIAVRVIYEEKSAQPDQHRFTPLKLRNIEQVNSVSWTLYASPEFLYKYEGNVSLSTSPYFSEYATNITDINTYSISKLENQDNLKNALANSNSLKDRQLTWMKTKENQQQQLFANVQDRKQQLSKETNFRNLQKIEQYGMDNLLAAQRVRRGSRQEVYKDTKSGFLAGENDSSFIERQIQTTEVQINNKQQQIRQQLNTPFYFDIEIPYGMQQTTFTKKQGDPFLIVKRYEKPENSKFWLGIQCVGLLLLIILSSIWKIFSFKEYSLQKFILTIVIVIATIFLCNFTHYIHNFYF